jgi:hemoglobin-like flavoprotein
VDISQSILRILNREDIVTDLFYDIFLDRHPEVQQYFVGVNLNHQAAVLRMSLLLIERHYVHETPASRQYLEVLGHRHQQRRIPLELYGPFRECLLETLQRFFGREWIDPLPRQWAEAIDAATRTMHNGYSREVTY